jgi:hypothetical protein
MNPVRFVTERLSGEKAALQRHEDFSSLAGTGLYDTSVAICVEVAAGGYPCAG